MSVSSEPDPVSLIAGQELEPRTYRCPNCRRVDLYADRLPTGGTLCVHCQAKISPHDVLEYARLRLRLLALFFDFVCVSVTTTVVLLFVGGFADGAAPKDESGLVVPVAAFWIAVVLITIALTISLTYLVIGNALGKTIGKRVVGLSVVDTMNGDPPGLARSLTRTEAQMLTICTLGLGYAAAARDARQQTLHDRIANTIVVVT